MNKADTIKKFISIQNIKLDSENNPVMVFDEDKKVVLVNNLFKATFKDSYMSLKPNYFFIKEKEVYRYFTEFEIDRLMQEKDTVFIYRTDNHREHAYNFITFYLGGFEGKKYYISILFEITAFKEKLVDETMHALVKASQMKDNDTGQHIYRLNEYSRVLSQYAFDNRMGQFPEIDLDFIERIGKVAAMHDIGKIGIPDYILTKPGKLDEAEFVIMREHTINGAFILSELAGKMARDIALFHHERWDGAGYPYNLREEQIPLSSRIVSISDVYDALRMKRCYKEPFSQEKTIDIIKESSGKQFDPAIVEIFLEVSDRFDDIFSSLNDDTEEIEILEEQ